METKENKAVKQTKNKREVVKYDSLDAALKAKNDRAREYLKGAKLQ